MMTATMTATSQASPATTSPQVDHALEIRSEVLKIICGDEAKHRGESDRLEIGAGGGTDQVSGDETLTVGGTLREQVEHSAQMRAARFDSHVKGKMDLSVSSDMTLLGGAMSETWAGAVLTMSGMSDNMVGGIGTRVSVLDMWLSGLTGMEEKIATVAADLAFVELYVNHMEREYTAGSHLAGVAVFSGAVFTTMATGFRQLVKVASGVRDLGSGGDGGGGGGGEGGEGSAGTPPPPVPGGGNPGMLNDVDDSSSAEDVRRAADTPPVDKPKRQVHFADDDAVILFEDGSIIDDVADVEDVRRTGEVDDVEDVRRVEEVDVEDVADVEDVRQGDGVDDVEDVRRVEDVGDGDDVRRGEEVQEDVVEEVRLRDVDDPPEVPERSQGYYDKVMSDKRKKDRIALALELQEMEKQFEGSGLTEYERLQEMQKLLLEMQKQTDQEDTVRLEEIRRLLENNKSQQADLVRTGKDKTSRAKRLETVYDFADDVVDPAPPVERGYDFADDVVDPAPPLPPRDPDLVTPAPAPRPVPQTLSPEDYRKLYGVPDDFDFDNEWSKFQDWNRAVDEKNMGGIAGDPNNSYVSMTLADAQKQIQELAKAYYDEALPPEDIARVGYGLGENPTPTQVRKLLVDMIDEQRRIGTTWVSDLSASDLEDIKKLEDLLNSFDANVHHLMQEATDQAKAFANMEWKRLPEGLDTQKLLDALDRAIEQAEDNMVAYMNSLPPDVEPFGEQGVLPDYARLNVMMEELGKVKRNVAAGYDPGPIMDMNIRRLTGVLDDGGATMDPRIFEKLRTSMEQTILVNEDLKKTWATILDSTPPVDLDVEDMLWRFEKEAWFQRNTGDQGTNYWQWGTNTEGATIVTQGHGDLRTWADDFAKRYGVEVTKHDYGDQTEKVRQWYTDKYNKVADRGLTLDRFISPAGVNMPPGGEFRNIRRSFLDAIAAAEVDDVARAEELRKALSEFDRKMYSSISSYTRRAEAVFSKPTVLLDPGFDVKALSTKFEELQIHMQLVEAPQAADALTAATETGKGVDAAGDRLLAATWKASAFNRAKQAVEEGRDPLAEILDMMHRPRYHIEKGDALADSSAAQLKGLQEAYDAIAKVLRNPQYRKTQAIIGDDIAGVLKRLPERYERVIVPRGAETPEDVRRAFAPLRGDLTEMKDWEVIWYHRHLLDNTRQADDLKSRFPSAFTETLSFEYHKLSQLYEDEWMRRFNTVDQLEEVFRQGARAENNPLDLYVDPYVERFIGRGGQTVLPDPDLVDKLTRFSDSFQPFVGRESNLAEKWGDRKWYRWEFSRKNTWQGDVLHTVSGAQGSWDQHALARGLGNRPGAYDILGDIDVVLEGIRFQLQKGIDPNVVFDSYLTAGRRLYFDDDMLSVSDSVVEVLRDAVNKLLADSGVRVAARNSPGGSSSGFRTIESLGTHIVHYLQKGLGPRGATLGGAVYLLDSHETVGEHRRDSDPRPSGGSPDAIPELLGEDSWVSVLEDGLVRWQWSGDGEEAEEAAYTGMDEDEDEDEELDEPDAEGWLGPDGKGREAWAAVIGNIPWRKASLSDDASLDTAQGDPTDISDAPFAGLAYYTATTPRVGSVSSAAMRPLSSGENAGAEGEDSYATRRALLERHIGQDAEFARPPLTPLPGFGRDAEKLLFQESEEESGRAPVAVPTGSSDEVVEVLAGAATQVLRIRDEAMVRRLILDAREAWARGVKLRIETDAAVGMVPELFAGVGHSKGFRGRPRVFPWGHPWRAA